MRISLADGIDDIRYYLARTRSYYAYAPRKYRQRLFVTAVKEALILKLFEKFVDPTLKETLEYIAHNSGKY